MLCLNLSPGFWKNTLSKSVHVVEILQNSVVTHVACQWVVRPGLRQQKCPESERIMVENHPVGNILGVNNLSCCWWKVGLRWTSANPWGHPRAVGVPSWRQPPFPPFLLSSSFRIKICLKNWLDMNMETRGFPPTFSLFILKTGFKGSLLDLGFSTLELPEKELGWPPPACQHRHWSGILSATLAQGEQLIGDNLGTTVVPLAL